MFHHKIDRDTPSWVVFHWLLLSFLGGSVNSGGLLACGRFVSHVTGFYTLFGQSAANMAWDAAAGLFSIPFYFLVGVMISAYLVERPVHRAEKPHYVIVMGMVWICLSLVSIFGHVGIFGVFGETHLKSSYLFLALLCMASGLLNGAVSVASGHTVRITHMTGNTTDLGIGIVRSFYMRRQTLAHADEVRAVRLRFAIISAFAAGSATSAILFLRYQYDGFLLPAAIALYTSIWEFYFNRKNTATGLGTQV